MSSVRALPIITAVVAFLFGGATVLTAEYGYPAKKQQVSSTSFIQVLCIEFQFKDVSLMMSTKFVLHNVVVYLFEYTSLYVNVVCELKLYPMLLKKLQHIHGSTSSKICISIHQHKFQLRSLAS